MNASSAVRELEQALLVKDHARAWGLFVEQAGLLGTSEPLQRRFVGEGATAPTLAQLGALAMAWPRDPSVINGLSQVTVRVIEDAGFVDTGESRELASTLVTLIRRLLDAPHLDSPSRDASRTKLAQALSLAGPQFDAEARALQEELCGEDATNPAAWFDLGLFYKRRGHFQEGLEANRKALELGDESEALFWNLAICATGVRDGHSALAAWKQLRIPVSLGAQGLPEGQFGRAQVRLFTASIAEGRQPAPSDDSRFEYAWIERLSPCHGRVLTASFYDCAVEMGDVVIHDGAPIVFG